MACPRFAYRICQLIFLSNWITLHWKSTRPPGAGQAPPSSWRGEVCVGWGQGPIRGPGPPGRGCLPSAVPRAEAPDGHVSRPNGLIPAPVDPAAVLVGGGRCRACVWGCEHGALSLPEACRVTRPRPKWPSHPGLASTVAPCGGGRGWGHTFGHC